MFVPILFYIIQANERRFEHDLIVAIIAWICLFSLPKPKSCQRALACIFLILYYRTLRILYQSLDLAQCYVYKQHSRIVPYSMNILYNNFQVIENFCDLPVYNSILVLNYPVEVLEYFVRWIIPRKNICMVTNRSKEIMCRRLGSEVIGVDDSTCNYNRVLTEIREKIKTHYIFVYVTKSKTRMRNTDLGMMRTGIFHIAKTLDIPVTPIAVDYIRHTWGVIKSHPFHIHVGNTEHIDHTRTYVRQTRHFFKTCMHMFRNV